MTASSATDLQVLVLAGDRTAADPVAAHAGVACKAAVPAAGVPLLARVLDTMCALPGVRRILVVGPAREALAQCPGLRAALARERVSHLEPLPSPSRSAAAGLAALADGGPVFLTTADHALLTPDIAVAFLAASRHAGADVTVGLVPYALVQAAFPGVRRTVLRFRDGEYCTCNLFGIWTPAGGRVVDFWVNVERQRKHPVRLVAGVLGIAGVLGYLLGVLSLAGALDRASKRLGARIAPAILEDAQASVDVDTPEDLRRVESVLASRASRAARTAGLG